MSWAEDQKWEADWWGSCTNTLSEEWKQLAYFKRLGLVETKNSKWRFAFDMQGKSVADVGGGPTSFLLRCVNVHGWVIEPNRYPDWVYERYKAAKINVLQIRAEDWLQQTKLFDEVWMYNVMQHVDDPELVMNAGLSDGHAVQA